MVARTESQRVVVIPAAYREEPEARLNADYLVVLRLAQLRSGHIGGPTVEKLYGALGPIDMPVSPVYLKPPITSTALFFGHVVSLYAAWLKIPQAATACSLLEGTQVIELDVSELKLRPDDVSPEVREFSGLPTLSQLVDGLNLMGLGAMFLPPVSGVPRRLELLAARPERGGRFPCEWPRAAARG